ncbi:hypothetical protein GH733_006642 [Mirounga leonina]|nr:hypothetical protein GH733_006642 [Mirounga leonina]
MQRGDIHYGLIQSILSHTESSRERLFLAGRTEGQKIECKKKKEEEVEMHFVLSWCTSMDSPDSSTSPRVKPPPTSEEERTVRKEDTAQGKKQKIRTMFSQTQLYVLNDRFQRQKYLSLQQMQELSNILNLSYKQGYLRNTSGNLPIWSNQTWNNPNWSNQTWNSQSWSNHSWASQTWCPQAWNNQLQNCGEESLQPQIQFQQNSIKMIWVKRQVSSSTNNDCVPQPTASPAN